MIIIIIINTGLFHCLCGQTVSLTFGQLHKFT